MHKRTDDAVSASCVCVSKEHEKKLLLLFFPLKTDVRKSGGCRKSLFISHNEKKRERLLQRLCKCGKQRVTACVCMCVWGIMTLKRDANSMCVCDNCFSLPLL